MCFKGSTNPSDILKNQDSGYELIGIEAKGVNFSIKSTLDELRKYIKSGGLTRLYLAFPKKALSRALKLKKDLPEIGLISVDERGTIEIVKEAEKIEMKYDCIRFNVGLDEYLGLPTGERVKRIITVSIGMGKRVDSYISLFDQTI